MAARVHVPGRLLVSMSIALAALLIAALALPGAGGVLGATSAPDGAGEGAAVAAAVVDETARGEEAMVAVEGLSFRSGAGLSFGVIAVLPYGTRGVLVDGPVAADGYSWWAFSTAGHATPGWVAGEFLIADDQGASAGATATVAGDGLNLRATPGLGGAIVATLAAGLEVALLDGPVAADGYGWYEVRTPEGQRGWVAGDFLALGSGGGGFAVGAAVVVAAEEVNLREAPQLGATVLAQIAAGTAAVITGGPFAADGHSWYQIALDGGTGDGWVAGEFLSAR